MKDNFINLNLTFIAYTKVMNVEKILKDSGLSFVAGKSLSASDARKMSCEASLGNVYNYSSRQISDAVDKVPKDIFKAEKLNVNSGVIPSKSKGRSR
ncbi:MAG: hypothetical protein RLN62_01650 [Rickettsiales bacterium]